MLTRRTALGYGMAAFALPVSRAGADDLGYPMQAVPIGSDSWAVYGAPEAIATANGGAIGNVGFVRTGAGTVIIDCGPSLRFGTQLKTLAESITGEPVVRVYLTHLHPDHIFGAGAFNPRIVAATPAAVTAIGAEAAGFGNAMYSILGDWMRGTMPVVPGTVIDTDVETFGRHRFRLMPLAGHSTADLAVLDETSGILFAGDLVFHDRAPATPHADLGLWQATLETLARVPHHGLLPGHGPVDHDGAGLSQTRDWLGWLAPTLAHAVEANLDMTEAGRLPMPPAQARLAMARYEFERSVSHFYPRLETALLPRLDGTT